MIPVAVKLRSTHVLIGGVGGGDRCFQVPPRSSDQRRVAATGDGRGVVPGTDDRQRQVQHPIVHDPTREPILSFKRFTN